jgi:nucleotide-binding universal stress UspA family protein
MRQLNKILFVANGGEAEQSALAQAAALAETSRADLLTVIDISNGRDSVVTRSNETGKSPADKASLDEQHLRVTGSPVLKMEGGPRVEFDTDGSLQHAIEATKTHDVVIKPAGRRSFKLFQRCAEEDRRLLMRSTCPAWIVQPPRGRLHDQPLKVLAALDLDSMGSGASAAAVLAHAEALARKKSASLEVISTWRIPHELELRGRMNVTRLLKEMKKAHKKQLESLVSQYRLPRGSVHLIHGDAHEAIATFVEQNRIDLVVLDNAKLTGLKRVFTGTTAEKLLANVTCSVLALNEHATAARWVGHRPFAAMSSLHA